MFHLVPGSLIYSRSGMCYPLSKMLKVLLQKKENNSILFRALECDMKIIFWHALLALTTLSFHTHMIRLSFVPCELPLRELDGTFADRLINESGNTAEETHDRSQMSSSKSPPATRNQLLPHCFHTV